MDTFSHTLWGKGLFGYRKYGKWALLFGALPDLLSFGLYFIVRFITQGVNMEFGKPALESIPNWVFIMYDISHSWVIAFLFIIIFLQINKEICFPMLAWPFHILLDFPFHSKEYFPTPILWPISDYRFDGIPWSNTYVWFGNIACIIILFMYRLRK
ncbi:MAG: hypothetical protein CMG24_04515 [Candidatus Marinimicrobia bacterium]|nr:hypothetical protein [Candidatus Neomarinimicrobiota bacterium]